MLGVGVSFALSAKRPNKSKTVVLISGDGAFLSGGYQLRQPFKKTCQFIIIDNNGGLDCISQQQERLFKDGSHFATDLEYPIHGMFQGMGDYGELVTHKDEIEGAVRRAMEKTCLR